MLTFIFLILDTLKYMEVYEGIWGLFRVYEGIWKYMEVYKGGPNRHCAQSRMARKAREHEALMARNMKPNRTCSNRPLPTCKASIVVTATIFTLFKVNIRRWRPSAFGLNMCDWTSCSSPLGLHVPLPFGPCAIDVPAHPKYLVAYFVSPGRCLFQLGI